MAKDLMIRSSAEEFIIFKMQEKDQGIQVRYENENLWMTQKAIAELFDVQRPAITKHLNNIFNEQELDKVSVCSKMEHTAEDGKVYLTEYYNLDAIISVGYRVNSLRATQFRRWATNILKTFTIQGYALDKKRMKNGKFIDKDYFEKILEEIREIRLSERRFYQKVTDIYATSIDYDPKSPISINFFKKVQNKMHYAVSHQTAAEIIYNRADAEKDYICISDFTKFKEGKSTSDDIIRNWLRNRMTLEFLGTWESIYNPNFNSVEFDGFRKNAGLHTFTLSVSEWCEKTGAIGIYSKRGKYGGTYAHKDIAFEFASSISPVFKLYLIKEFEGLKQLENQNSEWDIKRMLTKNNYLIHTDAIKNYILPDNDYYKNKEWRKLNPKLAENS